MMTEETQKPFMTMLYSETNFSFS